MSKLDTFMEVYERHLREAHREYPGMYVYPESEIPTVLVRMRAAVAKGSMNKDSQSFRRTCKELGIKHTCQAIAEYIKEQS